MKTGIRSAGAAAFLLTLKRLEQIPLLVFLIFAFLPRAVAAQEAIYLVRHAEQVQEGDNPPLTEQGQQRARALAHFLAEARITAVYASEARRTRETAEPLAQALGLAIQRVPRKQTDALVARIRQEEPRGRVFVVGHSQTVPEILKALGHPEEITIDKKDYDNVFVIVLDRPELFVLRQRFTLTAQHIPGRKERTSETSVPLHTSSLDIQKAVLLEAESTPNISTEKFRQILAERSARVFDVRTYKEYAISHIPGAITVAAKPGTSREAYVSDIVEIGRVVKGDKGAPMVLYCSGPQCGKSKRVAAELVEAGYTNVRRYQLGIPVWRALGGVTKIEIEGVRYVEKSDQTAVFIDAREPEEFRSGTLPGARNIPRGLVELGEFDVRYRAWRHPGGAEVRAAKADGRLPMEDHNTRIIVFGSSEEQARWVAEALARNSFHNVSFCDAPYAELKETLQ